MNRGGIPALTDCAFTNNRGHGVWFTDHAMGELVRCRVLGSHGVGMLIETQSNPAIKHCTISGSRESGVLTARGGLGSFVGCTFAHNKPVGVTVGEGSNPVVFKSEFEANAPYHVLIMDGALGHVHGNRMAAVDLACIVLGGGARCIVADNEMLLGHGPSGRAVGPAVSTPQQQEHRGGKVDESGSGPNAVGERKEEKTGRTKRADAKKEAAVAACWSDSEGLVRGINPMDLQRLALGFSFSSTTANARTLAGARAHTHTHTRTHDRQGARVAADSGAAPGRQRALGVQPAHRRLSLARTCCQGICRTQSARRESRSCQADRRQSACSVWGPSRHNQCCAKASGHDPGRRIGTRG